MIRVLYVSYETWKLAAVAGLTVYERAVAANTVSVWVGTRDVAYQTDVRPDTYADYIVNYPSGQVAVPGEDEALALILNTETALDPRTPAGSPIVAQRELTLDQQEFLRIDNGTAILNVNGEAAGALLTLWNGTGVGDTGGDWTASGDGSESPSADAGSGTNGWDSGVTGANDETTFDNGSVLDVAGTYDTLTFQLQPKAFPGNANFQIQFRNAASNLVGNALQVDDYTTNMDLDVWQQVQIPIADFGLTEDVQRLRFVYKVGTQQHWIDDIELQASGGAGPFTFRVAAPDTSVAFHLSMLVLVIAGPSSGWNPNTFANIAALTNGLLLRHRRISTGETLWKFNSKDNTDLFGRFHPQDDITFSDGSLLVGFMVKPGKASVVITDDDVLEVVVRDDLVALTSARGYVHYGIEVL